MAKRLSPYHERECPELVPRTFISLEALFSRFTLPLSNLLLLPSVIHVPKRKGAANHHAPSALAGTSGKLIQFPRISNDDPLLKSATASFPGRLFHYFACIRSKLAGPSEKSTISTVTQIPERKAPPSSTVSSISMSKMESHIEASPYVWPHDGTFNPKTTALVIIDMQKDCALSRILSVKSLPSEG